MICMTPKSYRYEFRGEKYVFYSFPPYYRFSLIYFLFSNFIELSKKRHTRLITLAMLSMVANDFLLFQQLFCIDPCQAGTGSPLPSVTKRNCL